MRGGQRKEKRDEEGESAKLREKTKGRAREKERGGKTAGIKPI